MKSKLTKSDNENCDLRFLNTQYLNKLRLIERESNSKSKKILELQERSLHAANAIIQISNSNGIFEKKIISHKKPLKQNDFFLRKIKRETKNMD